MYGDGPSSAELLKAAGMLTLGIGFILFRKPFARMNSRVYPGDEATRARFFEREKVHMLIGGIAFLALGTYQLVRALLSS